MESVNSGVESCPLLKMPFDQLVSAEAIYRAPDLSNLQQLSRLLPNVLCCLVNAGFTASPIAQAISTIGEAITCRLLQLGEARLGPPPVPYVFIVAGSMARHEQTAHSDQDHGMILANSYQPAVHDDYFAELAKWVSDGLDTCGYAYCPGNIMATNPQWRLPLSEWQEQFQRWIATPAPQALLHASIFFDLRGLYGEQHLFRELRSGILQQTRSNRLFQAFMAANATRFKPPLGFLKRLQYETLADGRKVIHTKKHGIAPVTDLARVYVLACGSPVLNTQDRLRLLLEHPDKMDPARVRDLLVAFDVISTLRLRHQVMQINEGQTPDHYIEQVRLSGIEQDYLKTAFEAVAAAQACMANHYQTERFS